MIESTYFGADICFPNFRSFPEFISPDRLYAAFDINDACKKLDTIISSRREHPHIVNLSDLGRQVEAYIMVNDFDREVNVWHEYNYLAKLINE